MIKSADNRVGADVAISPCWFRRWVDQRDLPVEDIRLDLECFAPCQVFKFRGLWRAGGRPQFESLLRTENRLVALSQRRRTHVQHRRGTRRDHGVPPSKYAGSDWSTADQWTPLWTI